MADRGPDIAPNGPRIMAHAAIVETFNKSYGSGFRSEHHTYARLALEAIEGAGYTLVSVEDYERIQEALDG